MSVSLPPACRRFLHPRALPGGRRTALAGLLAAAAMASGAETPAGVPAPPAPTADPASEPAPADPALEKARTSRAVADADARARRWSGGGALSYGYDSNIQLLADENPFVTNLDGAAITATAHAAYRVVNSAERVLSLVGAAELNEFPEFEEMRMWRIGGLATGLMRWRGMNPGFAAGAHRYLLDGEGVATAYTFSAKLATLSPRRVGIPSFDVLHLDYDDAPDSTGTLLALSYVNWWLLADHATHRRIEAGLRVGEYLASGDDETYFTVRPSAGMLWRFADRRERGTWELAARTWYEYREYDEGTVDAGAETQHLWTVTADLDHWWTPWLATGVYARSSLRASDLPDRDYDRIQAGVRVSATW